VADAPEHDELKQMMGAAVASDTSLTANQRVAAELLNDSFFKMSPEASFLLRISTVEALCPQADQTEHRRRRANFDTEECVEFRSESGRAGFEEAGREAVRAQRIPVEDQAADRR
jgi:hypothetical protein